MKTIIIIGAGRSGSTLLVKIFDAHPRISFHGETDFLIPRLWQELWANRFWFHWPLKAASGAYSVVNRRDNESYLNLRTDFDQEIPDALIKKARENVANVIRESFVTLLGAAQRKPNALAWGFKELWNGSSGFLYDWAPYDFVFPDAVWVHLVRNPFAFAQSVSQWNRAPLNMDSLPNTLNEWVKIVQYSRERRSTGRFFEIKFEDVLASPAKNLQDILAAGGVEWDEQCLEVMNRRVMQSRPEVPVAGESDLNIDQIHQLCAEIAGFKEICEGLGYRADLEIPNYFRSYKTNVKRSPWAGTEPNLVVVKLNAELQSLKIERQSLERNLNIAQSQLQALPAREAELAKSEANLAARESDLAERKSNLAACESDLAAREANLVMRETDLTARESSLAASEEQLRQKITDYFVTGAQSPERWVLASPFRPNGEKGWTAALPGLEGGADDEEHRQRSTLMLFEDERFLGPAHSLHPDIRALGCGRFSHWKKNLLFSTPDGSDPNTNGRQYTIVFLREPQPPQPQPEESRPLDGPTFE